MWTKSQIDRLTLERALLGNAGLTQFDLYYTADRNAYDVFGTTMTTAGNKYQLWIPIPSGFPDARPALYVVEPRPLLDAFGRPISARGVSHEMHTLTPSANGMVQICHWRDPRWHGAITLDKVLMKGLVWLAAYEQHLTTGEPICRFVTTMTAS